MIIAVTSPKGNKPPMLPLHLIGPFSIRSKVLVITTITIVGSVHVMLVEIGQCGNVVLLHDRPCVGGYHLDVVDEPSLQ